jgi:adenosylcobyric acid synthase
VRIRWVTKPDELAQAAAIVLPGSKNTIADLRWLRQSGLAEAVTAAARRGVPVAGICGGYQMLGRRLADPEGAAGDQGDVPGLGLLPAETRFHPQKEVRQVEAVWKDFIWTAYEIHMGRTIAPAGTEALLRVRNGDGWREEGIRCGNVWGTYLHGLFESPAARREFTALAGITDHCAADIPWRTHLHRVYDGMADLLEENLNLEGIRRYVEA